MFQNWETQLHVPIVWGGGVFKLTVIMPSYDLSLLLMIEYRR